MTEPGTALVPDFTVIPVPVPVRSSGRILVTTYTTVYLANNMIIPLQNRRLKSHIVSSSLYKCSKNDNVVKT